MRVAGMAGRLGAEAHCSPGPGNRHISAGLLLGTMVSICILFLSKRTPQCELNPGASRGHLTRPYFRQQLDIFTSKILLACKSFILEVTSMASRSSALLSAKQHHPRLSEDPGTATVAGGCHSHPNLLPQEALHQNTIQLLRPVTLGTIPNSYSDMKFNVLGMLFAAVGV